MSDPALTDADHLRAMMETPGWVIVEKWLEKSDAALTRATRDDLMQMRWEERDKWLPYYAGQAEVISKLRQYLKDKTRQPLTAASIKEWSAKKLGLDSK